MTKQSSRHHRLPIAAALACLISFSAPPPAQARDKEFGLLVHYVESHYHAHRQFRFVLGFASFAVNVVRPYGMRGVKLAIWENKNFADPQDGVDFPAVVNAGLGAGWQPVVRVWSRRDGERVVVFAQPAGKDVKFLVATVDHESAVVVQAKINPDKLSKCIDQWSRQGRHERHGGQNIEGHPNQDNPNRDDTQIVDSL